VREFGSRRSIENNPSLYTFEFCTHKRTGDLRGNLLSSGLGRWPLNAEPSQTVIDYFFEAAL
jgi:hypothetical protein